jgi:thiol-disulfide isomerase/thioredoxin
MATTSSSDNESQEALITFETLEEFNGVVADAKETGATLITCFSTAWCGPCKRIAPFLKEQAEVFKKDKRFVRLAKTVMDDDSEEDLMGGLVSDYGIRITGVPHFAVIQNGIYVKDKSWSGANRDLLVERLTEFSSGTKKE